MSVSSKNLTPEAREDVIPIRLDIPASGSTTDTARLYPPPSTAWQLVGFRWEIVTPASAMSTTIGITVKDAAANDAITPISLAIGTLQQRGVGTLSGADAVLGASGNGGNPYHEVVFTGAASVSVQAWVYVRRVQPSGPASKARLA